MIDLGPIRAAAETARPAIEEVDLHAEGGLFGKLSPQRAELLLAFAASSARNVPALIAEVERLSPAAYLRGPEACCEGECDEEAPPYGQWCSHVAEHVATLADIRRADLLDELVGVIEEAARRLDRGEPPNPHDPGGDLTTLILEAVGDARDRLEQWQSTWLDV